MEGPEACGRHSLVTPIDWKLVDELNSRHPNSTSRHSLVTPIDWKRGEVQVALHGSQGASPFFGDAY